ncbi:MAG: F0F1 ATP synthase subunit B [Endozoicomonadaceae bacterium]|nr:F0F1 ATP synthase subunit B [Endozoicomonadaceae bacterium]MBE8233187.1 F0F1 ATP synthase subunit B [Endozoicomonadaceae bacterium]
MNLNATIIGQSLSFIFFIWFCMKFIWPPIIRGLEDRAKKIADSLIFSEKAKIQLDQAEVDAKKCLEVAQLEAKTILDQARKRASGLIDAAKIQAKEEAVRIQAIASKETEQEINQAKDVLRKRLASLVIAGVSTVIAEQIDETKHSQLIDQLAANL